MASQDPGRHYMDSIERAIKNNLSPTGPASNLQPFVPVANSTTTNSGPLVPAPALTTSSSSANSGYPVLATPSLVPIPAPHVFPNGYYSNAPGGQSFAVFLPAPVQPPSNMPMVSQARAQGTWMGQFVYNFNSYGQVPAPPAVPRFIPGPSMGHSYQVPAPPPAHVPILSQRPAMGYSYGHVAPPPANVGMVGQATAQGTWNPYGNGSSAPHNLNGYTFVPPAAPNSLPPATATSSAVRSNKNGAPSHNTPAATTTVAPSCYNVKPEPSVPPNWEKSYNDAIHIIAPFTTSPVQDDSHEYQSLAALVEPQLTISGINRIVNPELWKKFLQTRKELMSRKSEDLELLGALGIPEDELLHRAHVNVNFEKNAGVAAVEYSDNVALLFHCTRGKVEPILNQGLDERLGNATGLLGRGIYFADDPLKSMAYDANSTLLVFAVFLGDCLNVSNVPNLQSYVREPAKVSEQQRNHLDLFFDSIVGRPAGVNEFVIYNRNQCCPLYSISYTRSASAPQQDIYTQSRAIIPPFAWSPTTTHTQHGKKKTKAITISLPPAGNITWPFFAQTLFGQMRGDEETPADATNGADGGTDNQEPVLVEDDDGKNESIAMKLSMLWDLGFKDDDSNIALLRKLDYNLEQTIDCLLEGSTGSSQSPPPDPVPTKIMKLDKAKPNSAVSDGRGDGNHRTVAAATSTATSPTDGEEDCPICCVESPAKWRTMTCGHKLCETCYLQLETTGVTMSGKSHTFLKCPFCQLCSGLEIGSCPTGTMAVATVAASVGGYEQYKTYSITYNVPSPPGLNRVAYIPKSPEGTKVVELLRIAWDRRLCFSIGTSVTTGAQNVLVWNIHHKTALHGGIQAHGFPDPTYLTRVQEELAQYGIE